MWPLGSIHLLWSSHWHMPTGMHPLLSTNCPLRSDHWRLSTGIHPLGSSHWDPTTCIQPLESTPWGLPIGIIQLGSTHCDPANGSIHWHLEPPIGIFQLVYTHYNPPGSPTGTKNPRFTYWDPVSEIWPYGIAHRDFPTGIWPLDPPNLIWPLGSSLECVYQYPPNVIQPVESSHCDPPNRICPIPMWSDIYVFIKYDQLFLIYL